MDPLWKDYTDGPGNSRKGHSEEWVGKVEKQKEEAARKRGAHLMEIGYGIHFHVFTQGRMFKFISFIKERAGLGFEVKFCMGIGNETIFVLKKPKIDKI